jgi:hypothetical protein
MIWYAEYNAWHLVDLCFTFISSMLVLFITSLLYQKIQLFFIFLELCWRIPLACICFFFFFNGWLILWNPLHNWSGRNKSLGHVVISISI